MSKQIFGKLRNIIAVISRKSDSWSYLQNFKFKKISEFETKMMFLAQKPLSY